MRDGYQQMWHLPKKKLRYLCEIECNKGNLYGVEITV